MPQKIPTIIKGEAGGLKGFSYEIKIIFFFMIRACLNKVNFKLFTNKNGYGKFDDVVAVCEELKNIYCLQAKTTKKITSLSKEVLLKVKDFSLSEYCNSWNKRSVHKDDSNCELLIFTPCSLDNETVKWIEPMNDNLCKLFNTKEEFNCVKKIDCDNNSDITDKIDRAFLEKLYILSDQCSEKDFDKILEKELKKLIGDYYDEYLFLKLSQLIDDWYKMKHTEEDAFTNKKFLQLIWEIALTQIPCLKLENHLTDNYKNYRVSNITTSEILQNINSNSCVTLKSGASSTLLTLLEVQQIIRNDEKYCKNYFIVKLNELRNVIDIFKYCIDLIILDCDKSDGEHEESVAKLKEIMNENKNKKAVFILPNNSKVIVPKDVGVVNYKFQFDLLSIETQDFLLDRDIKLQGRDVKLNSLVANKDISKIIDCETVVKLLKNEPVYVGKELEGLKIETEKCYIERSFYNTHVVTNDVFKTSDIFLVSIKQPSDLGKHQNQFVNFKNIDYNTNSFKFFHISESKEENRKAVTKLATLFRDKNVHWLEVKQSQYIWRYTKGSVEYIKKYVSTSIEPENVVNIDIVIKNANQINIIVDTAGMGKTTILNKIAGKLKQENSTCWVLHYDINTNEMVKKLNEIRKHEENIEMAASELLKTYLVAPATKFEEELLLHLLKTEKLIICFDGFDEISITNEQTFITMIQKLKDGGARQVWVTSRKHMESTLLEHLPSFHLQLLPISEENQIDFCVKFYKFNIKQQNSVFKIKAFSKFLIDSMKVLDDSIQEMIGIPMLTNMIAMINIEHCQEYCNSIDEKVGSTKEIGNIYVIYMKFFELSVSRYLEEKAHVPEGSKAFENVLDKKETMRKHMYWAAISLLKDKYAELTKLFKYKLPNLDVSQKLLDIGIITSVLENNTKFLHFTFAEFFFACFLSDHENDNLLTENDEIQRLFDEVFYKKKWENVRHFLKYSTLPNIYKYNPLHDVASDQYTSLHRAAREGSYSIAEFLIKCFNGEKKDIKLWISLKVKENSSTDIEISFTALHIAARKGHIDIIELLLSHGADIEVTTAKGDTSLTLAAKKGKVETVRLLLEHGADVNHKDRDEDTALSNAACSGHDKTVKLLIDHEANVNHKNEDGVTALTLAANYGDVETVRLLLEHGADVNHKDRAEDTALTNAARNGHDKIVKLLIDHEANVNHKNKYGNTALTLAAYHEKVETVRLLLEHGADVNYKDRDEDTALTNAARNGHDKIVKLLIDHEANVNHKNENGNTALNLAAKYGHEKTVKLLINHEANVNHKNENGNTALTLAASNGKVETVRLLLEHGADVNHKDCDEDTALTNAARRGHDKTVKLLIDHEANVNHKNENGNTALTLAAKFGHDKIVKLLIDHEANVNHKNENGYTALTLAAYYGTIETVRLLLEHNADVNLKNNLGFTALMFAARKGEGETVRLLLQYKADVNHKNNDGATVLAIAARRGNLETVEVLQAHGAREEDQDGRTMLMHAAGNDDHEVFTYLLETGKYDIHTTDRWHQTALHLAARWGCCLNIKSLLDVGADINCQDMQGNTPLHEACAYRYVREQCVQYLVQRGADRNIKNNEGKTASDVCRNNKIKNWLREYKHVNTNFVDEKDLKNYP